MPKHDWRDLAGIVEHCDTTERHIRGLVARKAIPHYKLGGKLRFDVDEIDAWLDANRVEGAA